MNSVRLDNVSSKFTASGCKNNGIRKLEFVATEFLYMMNIIENKSVDEALIGFILVKGERKRG